MNIKLNAQIKVVNYEDCELKLEDILSQLFNKLKKVMRESINYKLKDIFVPFEKDIPYKLKIIIKTVEILSDINILKFIDLTLAMKYYLKMKKMMVSNFSSSILVKKVKL